MRKRLAVLLLLLCVLLGSVLPAGAAAPRYLLGVRDGFVGWQERPSGLWHSTGVPADALPNAADRAALARGLCVSGRGALSAALEDFCS